MNDEANRTVGAYRDSDSNLPAITTTRSPDIVWIALDIDTFLSCLDYGLPLFDTA